MLTDADTDTDTDSDTDKDTDTETYANVYIVPVHVRVSVSRMCNFATLTATPCDVEKRRDAQSVVIGQRVGVPCAPSLPDLSFCSVFYLVACG